tara:strand:- start:2576 stop:3793 length:1218 start_codon:yes stop_codon:yes gene_type:complete
MNRSVANCPDWLVERIKASEGSISFFQYMDWALNDPEYGAYAQGRLKIGRDGDFATSPSLGSDFAEILAIQLIDWLIQIDNKNSGKDMLSLVDIGPGEGDLLKDLANAIERINPKIFSRLQLILVEPNKGMLERQKEKLSYMKGIDVSWKTIDDLIKFPVNGIVIAHELLDALPVERLVFKDKALYRQGVTLSERDSNYQLEFSTLPLSTEIRNSLADINKFIGIKIPPVDACDNWCTEWHCGLKNWFEISSQIIENGTLLVVDYIMDAFRYYNATRSNGTLMAYKNNISSSNLFLEPGYWDLTSHLCLETLKFFAQKNGFKFLGDVLQGEALLSLGLAKRLYSLQALPNHKLAKALERRETLLKLVDPYGLGGFRWVAFLRDKNNLWKGKDYKLRTLFLEEPIN